MVRKYSASELHGNGMARIQRKLDKEYEEALKKWKKDKPRKMPVRKLTRRTARPKIAKRVKRVKRIKKR